MSDDPFEGRGKRSGYKRGSDTKNDPRCSFQSGGHRCPLPAVWYPGAVPHNTSGYCRMHDSDDKRALEPWEAQAQIQRISESPSDYLADLYPADSNWREQALQAEMAKHPEWQRGADEGRSEYHSRMLAAWKRMAR